MASCTLTLLPAAYYDTERTDREEDRRGEGAQGEEANTKANQKPPTPPCLTYRSVRGGRAIQGHPLVASTASCLVYWNLSSSV